MKLNLSEELAYWMVGARRKAEELSTLQNPTSRWINANFPLSFPASQTLKKTLSELLRVDWTPPQSGQLSALQQGYTGIEPAPHVDGAYEGLHWYGLLVGIYLVDVPLGKAGNLKVWPGSHRQTQAEFDKLGKSPTQEEVINAINRSNSVQGDADLISGLAGTAILLDHRVCHAMDEQSQSNFTRYAVYYRLPWKTRNPVEVINPKYFLKLG